MATQTEEPSLRNDVPEDDIAVLAARSEDGARGAEAEGGGSGAVAVEGCLASTCFRVPQPDAPICVPARNRRGDSGGGGGSDAGDGERRGGGGRCEGDRGKTTLEVPGGEAVEGGGEEAAARGVVDDVRLRRRNHTEGEGRLVAEVSLHHGGRPPARGLGGSGSALVS